MRVQIWSIFLIFATVTLAFTSEDIEIFELNDKLQKLSSKYSNFYEFLGLTIDADYNTINKEFKKLSIKYHPDKFATKSKKLQKKANDHYEFLQLVSTILKNGYKRDKYDYYLKNGFPKYDTNRNRWFVYKFKPGLVFIFAFLFLIFGATHYFILKINHQSQRAKLQTLINDVKRFAGDDEIINEKRVYNELLDQHFVVRIDGVFLIENEGEQNEKLVRISKDDILPPSLKHTILMRLPVWIWNSTIGNIKGLYIDLSDKEPESYEEFTHEEKKKKKTPKGEKLVLPNGKVVYSKKNK